ncbi:MAG TPA: zf-HC2 domain-containing protein, partial [Chloroflexia bacterium]
MTCARYRALISRYLDDELTPRQRTELLDHVKHCASCAADLARYRQAEVLLRKIPEGQPAPELKLAVLREARRRRRRERHSLIWLLSAGGRANPRIVACLLAIGLLLPVLAGVLLPVASGQPIGARFGFSAPATPTSAYLDVPESPTPPPPGPLSPPHLVTTKPY